MRARMSVMAAALVAAALCCEGFAEGVDRVVDVVATGYGTTVREATKAAMRSAVEAVVGTMLDATTLVENDKLIEDEILTYSGGMIAGARTIGEPKKSADGIYTVKVKASVKKGVLEEKLRAASAVNVTLDGADLFARMTAAKDNLSDAEAMVKSVLAKHVDCVVAETIPGKNGNSPIDLDPKTGEVFVNVRVRIDQARYTHFANDVVEKIGAMAADKIKIKPDDGYNPRLTEYSFDSKKYQLLVVTSLKTGSAVGFSLEKNILDAVLSCLDTGSIAVDATLFDTQGGEIAAGDLPLCKERCGNLKYYVSLFSCTDDALGVIMPFYNASTTRGFGCWSTRGCCSTGTFQISLGRFTPEELKSIGKLEIKVGHMKGNRFFE